MKVKTDWVTTIAGILLITALPYFMYDHIQSGKEFSYLVAMFFNFLPLLGVLLLVIVYGIINKW